MDPLDVLDFLAFMAPFVVVAAGAFWICFEVWRVRELRARAPLGTQPGPDPAIELERVNTETARGLAQARLTLEATRDTLRRGIKG